MPSTTQNKSCDEIKKVKYENINNKMQKNQIFKNPRSIKDSIMNGKRLNSSEDIKISDLLV